MNAIPFDLGKLHFVGIGGIGMSGIAEILHNLGYQVQGSDQADNANVQRLRDLGIEIVVGHDKGNLRGAQVVVVSSAIKPDNPELQGAQELFIPIVQRAEMLGELMRLKWSIAVGGTHGKTTTTSMVAAVLDAASFDPTVINGGIINAYGTNARLGAGDWIVVEADESDGSFVRLPAILAVVTNIDPEHMDFYGSIEALHEAFLSFIENIPFYSAAILCIDNPTVQSLIGQISNRRIVTYGLSPQADVRGDEITMDTEGSLFDVIIADRKSGDSRRVAGLRLPMLGQHNVTNALAAVAIAQELAIPDEVLRQALAGFRGVKRRFTKVGEVDGITIIDDYGHHPVEIAAVLKAARAGSAGRVIAVVQPHRYTRLASLFEEFCGCFNDADHVIVAEVFAAGEEPIEGVGRDAFVEGLRARGHRHAMPLSGPENLASQVSEVARSGDLVVCLGAGNITAWAAKLPEEMARLKGGKDPKPSGARR